MIGLSGAVLVKKMYGVLSIWLFSVKFLVSSKLRVGTSEVKLILFPLASEMMTFTFILSRPLNKLSNFYYITFLKKNDNLL